VGGVVDLADVAGHAGDAGGLGELLALDLVAHGRDGAGVGADEHDPLVGAALGEAGVLGQEAEARMHGLGAGLLAGGDDLVGHQVGLVGRARADVHGLVGHLDGQAVGVGVGIDHHRLDAQATAGLDHADRDLARLAISSFLNIQAETSASFRRPTSYFQDAVKGGTLNAIFTGALAIEGGELLIVDGKIVGAIGASGGSGAQDGMVARAGVAALK
jgi:hypothetical protein